MITHEEARRKVRLILDSFEEEHRKTEELRKDLTPAERKTLSVYPMEDCRLVISDDLTIEGDFGWVFFWTSLKHRQTGELKHALLGNAPFLVSRKDGTLHETGTAHPTEHYIENFKRHGDPNG